MTQATLTAAFNECANSSLRGLSIVDRAGRQTRRTWAAVVDGSRRIAGRLQSVSVEPGDRVALVYGTGFDFVEAFFGTLLSSAVPVPLYPPVRLGRLEEYHRRTSAMLRSVDASLLLCDGRIRRILGETIARTPLPHGCRTIDELPSGLFQQRDARPDELCLIQFSSGTTVEPKPVALTHQAVMAQVRTLNAFWPDSEDVRHSGVSWLPLYHDMGLIGCLLTAVERPGDLTLIPPELFVTNPALWLQTLSATRATISPAPNFAYGLCVDKISDRELDGVDLSNWRVALNGAETVVGDIVRSFSNRFSRWGFRPEAMTPVYGLSEAALAVTFSALEAVPTSKRLSRKRLSSDGVAREDPQGVEIVSVGTPIPGCAVEIRGMNGEQLDDRRAGRVWVQSPSLMDGFFGNASASASTLVGAWLDTGDLGFLYDGELFLTGRAKDVLILRGLNHLPDDVEGAVDGIAGLRTGCSAAVSYLPENAAGEILVLLAERSKEATYAEKRDLVTRCHRSILSKTGLDASRIEILEPGTLPRTSSGKIRRQKALELYLLGALTPPEKVTPLRLLRTMAKSQAAVLRSRRSRRDPDRS
jgi:acyl-CoA synthetase (AMP-forming)/AMP-acid ligase II